MARTSASFARDTHLSSICFKGKFICFLLIPIKNYSILNASILKSYLVNQIVLILRHRKINNLLNY